MIELLPFFIVLFATVFFSELFFRFKFPWVVALILGGIVIGPSFLGIFEINGTIEFLGEIGLVFLMFMAGLETNMLKKRHTKSLDSYLRISLINSIIPFTVGIGIALWFGFDTLTMFFLGTIFISSSVAAIVPTLESRGLLRCGLGRTIISSVVVSDVLSLLALSILLQISSPMTSLPLPIFYLILFILLLFLKWFIPKIRWFFKNEVKDETDIFQQELRSIFVILIGTALSFELLGLHPIVAGFFAGLVLSDSINTKILKEKIRAISYGIFIPVFFVVIGAKTDFVSLFKAKEAILLTVVLIIGIVGSKIFSGYLGGITNNLSKKESLILGVSTTPQLSTTLAVAFAGFELGLIDGIIVTALVATTIVTTVAGSYLIGIVGKNYIRDEVEAHQKRSGEYYYG